MEGICQNLPPLDFNSADKAWKGYDLLLLGGYDGWPERVILKVTQIYFFITLLHSYMYK